MEGGDTLDLCSLLQVDKLRRVNTREDIVTLIDQWPADVLSNCTARWQAAIRNSCSGFHLLATWRMLEKLLDQ